MKVGVCDFPSVYAFPPHGYGGIERWLWAVAFGGQQAEADIHLIGPSWRGDLPGDFGRVAVRLEALRPGDHGFHTLELLDLDVLVVGHEYPSLASWRDTWSELGCRVVTFQHDPNFRHAPDAFDGDRSRLYCYSPEMVNRYSEHAPTQTLSVQFGAGEENPPSAVHGDDLVWLGRIDQQKAPHIAVEAACLLGRKIRLIGPILDQGYAQRYARALNAPHVELVGEVAGDAKLDHLRQGRVLVYTHGADYVEAGAAVFGEALRSGTPVAALAWRPGTCAHAALCEHTGALASLDTDATDREAAQVLAEAIVRAERLDAAEVQAIGLDRFDPGRHFRVLVDGQPA
ncbi:hypothetical protein [Actinokineospora sp.]|uniref:hypothetical protein n=1 Tax=Actinokineospora sp. TaxID=1872133 RepID=UPI004037D692